MRLRLVTSEVPTSPLPVALTPSRIMFSEVQGRRTGDRQGEKPPHLTLKQSIIVVCVYTHTHEYVCKAHM